MSNLRFLERLLGGAKMEWRPLGEEALFEIANSARRPVKASLRAAGDTPYYGANNVQDYVEGYTHKGEFVLIAEDGSASLESYSIQYATGRFWANNHVHVLRGTQAVNTRYLFHYLRTVNFIPFLTGGGRAKLTKAQLVGIDVPIPCPQEPKKSLAIQAEIVRILDTFTELTTELTTELKARNNQYNHYRDKLLSFDDGEVEWKMLGKAVSIQRGRRLVKSQLEKAGEFAVFQNSLTPLGYYHEANVEEDSAFIVCAGAAGEIGYSKAAFWAADDVHFFVTPDTILSKYLYYWMLTQGPKILAQVRRASIPRLAKAAIEKLEFPIPCPQEPKKSLAIQAEIVRILDTFTELTTELTTELKARNNQYNHYRDLLLSFPKPNKVA